MTTTPAFCPLSLQTLLDQNAAPIVGGKVWTFDAGTTTARTVFRDPALSSAHPNPILTDGFGRIPAIYVGPGAYKVVLQDASGGEIATADQLPGGVTSTTPTPDTSTVIPPGFIAAGFSTGALDGWVIANGKTLGSASSSASGLAADTTLPLFSVLWNENASLAVSGGRGLSATADWNAGKAIALPDLRDRALVGRDSMGSSAAGGITSATTATPDQVGTLFGAEAVALTTPQLASHTHTATIGAAGGFTPAGTLSTDAGHTHSGTTDVQNAHSHTIPSDSFKITGATGTTEWVGNVLGFANNTGTQPGHAHNYTTGTGGVHSHTFSGTAVADHTHTPTISAAGSGSAHPNMPPGMLVTWYIKL